MQALARDPDEATISWAVALHRPADAAPLADALHRNGYVPELHTDPGEAFAAVVRGAGVLIVDTGAPGALDLLESTHRRITEGWSNCAVVAYHPPDSAVDADLTPLIDAVARYPIAAANLELALRVANGERDDRAVAR